MVGYYQTDMVSSQTSLSSISHGIRTLESMNPVKSLVCSPDLTVFTSSPCGGETTLNRATSMIGQRTMTLPPAQAASSPPRPTPSPIINIDEKPYQCLLCRKSFEQKSLYQSHLRSHGKEGEDPYRCNICGKTFAVPARLTRHYRTHTGEKPYQCEYCSKSFSVKENLSVHRRIHTKERPYKCDVCERAFEHSGKLHRHMRIHTGERPHKCTVCSKTFIQSGQLVIHMRTHTGEKPYVCKECGKGFTCSKQLKVHTRTHTGEKPYTCDICGKSFGYNHVLKLHQVAHYGEKVYKCTLCHETFGSKKNMEIHIKTHSPANSSGSPSPAPRDGTPTIEPVIEISQSLLSPMNSNSQLVTGVNNGNNHSDKENYKTDESDYCTIQAITAPTTVTTTTATTTTPQIVNYTSLSRPEFSYYLYPREQQQQQHHIHHHHQQQQLQYSQSMTPINNPALLRTSSQDNRSFNQTVTPSSIESTINHHHLHHQAHHYPNVAQDNNFNVHNEDLLINTNVRTGAAVIVDSNADCSSLLNLPGNVARRRVEAALEAVEEERQREYGEIVTVITERKESMLTPPSSNPVSPAPSSPDPLDLAVVPNQVKETLILPPRKRCKMILESMESEKISEAIASYQRKNSVIRFARAS